MGYAYGIQPFKCECPTNIFVPQYNMTLMKPKIRKNGMIKSEIPKVKLRFCPVLFELIQAFYILFRSPLP